MNKVVWVFTSFLLAIGLASCGILIPPNGALSNQEIIGKYETVSVLLTQTSQLAPLPVESSITPKPLATVTAALSFSALTQTLTDTPVPMVTLSTPTRKATLSVPCDQARAGMPIDVTIPDDTRLYPEEFISKTWRLVNVGNCTWDSGYAVVWFSGDDLGAARVQNFNNTIDPGQSVDITIDMQAPEVPGVYQSNWKLRSKHGTLFGIGPGGGAPFWVRIVVVPNNTETPGATQLPPTATLTPEVFNSGAVILPLDTGLDLDSGTMNQVVDDDLRILLTDQGQTQLMPENGARLISFGMAAPEFADCSAAAMNIIPVLLEEAQPGAYLCFRTTEGLPGWVVLQTVDLVERMVTLEFVTWAVP